MGYTENMKQHKMQRLCALLLIGLLLLTSGCAASSAQLHNQKSTSVQERSDLTAAYRLPQTVANATNKHRHAVTEAGYTPPAPKPPVVPSTPSTPSTPSPAVAARQAFVYDYTQGLTFTQGGMYDALYPASITKLVTALVVLEHVPTDYVCTVGDELSLVDASASIAHLQKGKTYTVAQLLSGMLLPSGCDASYTLAANVGKVLDPSAADAHAAVGIFLREMNGWAQRNGMNHSQFKNPDGFHAAGHYSCMQDLLTLAILCQRNATIMSIVGQTSANGWNNSNLLLYSSSAYYNPACVGLKTGTTGPAGNCLLSAFVRDGQTVIIGVFGAPTSAKRYTVTNYLYQNYA